MIARISLLLLAMFGGSAVSLHASAEECGSQPSLAQIYSDSWGLGLHNQRYQARSSITARNVGRLSLAWAFALDDDMSPHSYPVVTDDSIIIGTSEGNVYALDKRTGCTRWAYRGDGSVRTAIVYGKLNTTEEAQHALYFGTGDGHVIALNALSGERLWRRDVRAHLRNVVTGSPVFHKGKLHVPLSSFELGLAISPFYECCTSSGAIITLDATSGEIEWRTHTTAKASVQGQHWYLVNELGPSGAPIWSAPTLDPNSGMLFAGTGENYTAPATTTSDAIIAFDINTGEIKWQQQFTENDTFNMACTVSLNHPNCPDNPGPDHDFGAPPILVNNSKGEPLLLAGQKSSSVYALKAGSGAVLWKQHLGRGGYLGGVHWGMAVNERLRTLYVPISDLDDGPALGAPAPGVHALDIDTGALRWKASKPSQCTGRDDCKSGFSSAILATSDLVFAATLDGMIYAIDANDGRFLWQFDSWGRFAAVNAKSATGGTIDVHGPLVADDQMIIQSGYGAFGLRGGNALLVFEIGEQ